MNNSKYYILYLFLLTGCIKEDDKQLSYALELAGKNRPELEQVLKHYENDIEKYSAVCYLIKNMPGHYSYNEQEFTRFNNQVDSFLGCMPPVKDYRDSEYTRSVIDNLAYQYKLIKRERKFDIHTISSDLLIKNTDDAFDLWKSSPWAQHVSLEDFCEYLLPYRIDDGFMLEDWRKLLKDQLSDELKEKLDKFEYSSEMKNSAYWACKYVNAYLRKKLNPDHSPLVSPDIFQLSRLARIPYGTCDDHSMVAMGFMRSLGIPVAFDFTYQWPFRSKGHGWNVLFANSGKEISFNGSDTGPEVLHKPEQKMAKVYRKTYSMNREIIKMQNEEKIVPDAFRNIFIKDVTEKYVKTFTVKIPIKWDVKKKKYAYLAVFNNAEWIPVCYGKKEKDCFVFENIGNEIAYLPVYYTSEGIKVFADPFILNIKGKVISIVPDSYKKQQMELYRKYFLSQSLFNYAEMLQGGIFEASNDPEFSTSDSLYTITHWSETKDSVLINSPQKYRYWRFLSPPESRSCIAELEFYTEEDSLLKPHRIIGTSHPENPKRDLQDAFDGDPLSFFQALPDVKNAWIGCDFEKPIRVKKITYTPRNGDNNIRVGDTYELFYWEENNWKSLGKQVGNSHKIVYNKVPENALFLLKDLTRGNETRIFTYQEGKQIWW